MSAALDKLQRNLRRSYIDRLPARIRQLEAFHERIAQSDATAIAEAQAIAHQLAGSGASYGFEDITGSARAFERAPAEKALTTFEQLLDTLNQAKEMTSDPPG